MTDPERAVSISVETTADGVRMRIETGSRWVLLELPREEVQKLALVMLHHAGIDDGREPS